MGLTSFAKYENYYNTPKTLICEYHKQKDYGSTFPSVQKHQTESKIQCSHSDAIK